MLQSIDSEVVLSDCSSSNDEDNNSVGDRSHQTEGIHGIYGPVTSTVQKG